MASFEEEFVGYQGSNIADVLGGDALQRPESEKDKWLLGKCYDADDARWDDDYNSLVWCSYRKDFPRMAPYSYTSDAGWGCMLRASQMMMVQALKHHLLGRHWRIPRPLASRREHGQYCQLLQWFLDYPGERCLFSIHNMIQLGQQYDQLPGEWFGPTTASLVMRDLAVVQQHCLDGSLCVHVAPSDVVYIDDIESICGPLKGEAAESGGADEGGVASGGGGGGGDGGEGGEGGEGGDEANAGGAGARGGVDAHSEGTEEAKGADRAAPANVAADVAADVAAVAEAGTGEAGTAPATAGASLLPPATATDPLAAADPLSAGGEFLDPLLNSSTPEEAAKAAEAAAVAAAEAAAAAAAMAEPWSVSMLLIVPVRLGLDRLNAEYVPSLLKCLEMPQSVGIIGGRPNHAIYFFGHQGDMLHGLDPHTTQPTPEFDATPRPHGGDASADAHRGGEGRAGGGGGSGGGGAEGGEGGGGGGAEGAAGEGSGGSSGGRFIPSDAHLRSVQVPASPTCMHVERLDPSLALAFFIRDRNDFNDWAARVHEMSERTKGAFALQTTAPKYEDDENDCFDGLMSDNDGDSASLGDTEGDEEDEYVLI